MLVAGRVDRTVGGEGDRAAVGADREVARERHRTVESHAVAGRRDDECGRAAVEDDARAADDVRADAEINEIGRAHV